MEAAMLIVRYERKDHELPGLLRMHGNGHLLRTFGSMGISHADSLQHDWQCLRVPVELDPGPLTDNVRHCLRRHPCSVRTA